MRESTATYLVHVLLLLSLLCCYYLYRFIYGDSLPDIDNIFVICLGSLWIYNDIIIRSRSIFIFIFIRATTVSKSVFICDIHSIIDILINSRGRGNTKTTARDQSVSRRWVYILTADRISGRSFEILLTKTLPSRRIVCPLVRERNQKLHGYTAGLKCLVPIVSIVNFLVRRPTAYRYRFVSLLRVRSFINRVTEVYFSRYWVGANASPQYNRS